MVALQAQARGVAARNFTERLREIKEIEETCADAMEARNAYVLEGALSRAGEFGLNSDVVKKARDLLVLVKREAAVDEKLGAARPA